MLRETLCAAVAVLALAVPAPNVAHSILLTDEVETHGARCLDGTPQRLWYSAATSDVNASKWYIHLMGGGWCESMESCTARAYDATNCYRGSSNVSCFNANGDNDGKPFNETMDWRDIPCINGARWGGGLLMADATTNPLTHDWNKVEIVYCDGGSFSGNNETVSRVSFGGRNGLPLYFRGSANFAAALDWLDANMALGQASTVVLSGDSAGGLATYWHADRLQSRLPKARVYAVPDSGFFIGAADAKPSWPLALQWIVNQMNATGVPGAHGGGLDSSCVAAAEAAGRDPGASCTLPEDVAPYVHVPLFVLNSRFDPALDSISGGAKTAGEIRELGRRVLEAANASVLHARNGNNNNAAFITSCAEHCGQWAQGQQESHGTKDWNDFNVTIDGWNAATAVNSWVLAIESGAARAATRNLWLQGADYPCKTCCHGGNA